MLLVGGKLGAIAQRIDLIYEDNAATCLVLG
jgi:hypothetical protein